jgi:magnesium transporter
VGEFVGDTVLLVKDAGLRRGDQPFEEETGEVTEALAVVATIVIPLTVNAGVDGTNSAGGPVAMPELEWTCGYPAVMLGMTVLEGVLVVSVRRRGWV